MEKNAESRLSSPIRIRLTKNLDKAVRSKAMEKGLGVSEFIRQVLEQYLDNSFSDTALLNHTLSEHNRKIGYLENKVDLAAMIIMELVRHQIRHLPEKQFMSEDMVEKRYEKFMQDCANSLSGKHRGILEGMVLDIYEQTGSEM
ncbi:MAG: ribbon-helix-helix protein, CopG family [Treponemataceae bacterium]|nr:ribbon-helix-helix protein, CopG family [Treponemataceae bacterium]